MVAGGARRCCNLSVRRWTDSCCVVTGHVGSTCWTFRYKRTFTCIANTIEERTLDGVNWTPSGPISLTWTFALNCKGHLDHTSWKKFQYKLRSVISSLPPTHTICEIRYTFYQPHAFQPSYFRFKIYFKAKYIYLFQQKLIVPYTCSLWYWD